MEAKKVLKLDLLAIRPYLTMKNLIILIFLCAVYAVLLGNPVTVISTSQIFTLLFAGYPFMVGEESGIDPLYRIFDISPADVVRGRYMLATLLVASMIAAGTVIAFIASIFYHTEDLAMQLLIMIPVTFMITSLVIYMEYPLYFKYGYSKGKALASAPFIIVGILVLCMTFFKDYMRILISVAVENIYLAVVLLVIVWAAALLVSYRFSCKIYSERDF